MSLRLGQEIQALPRSIYIRWQSRNDVAHPDCTSRNEVVLLTEVAATAPHPSGCRSSPRGRAAVRPSSDCCPQAHSAARVEIAESRRLAAWAQLVSVVASAAVAPSVAVKLAGLPPVGAASAAQPAQLPSELALLLAWASERPRREARAPEAVDRFSIQPTSTWWRSFGPADCPTCRRWTEPAAAPASNPKRRLRTRHRTSWRQGLVRQACAPRLR